MKQEIEKECMAGLGLKNDIDSLIDIISELKQKQKIIINAITEQQTKGQISPQTMIKLLSNKK